MDESKEIEFINLVTGMAYNALAVLENAKNPEDSRKFAAALLKMCLNYLRVNKTDLS